MTATTTPAAYLEAWQTGDIDTVCAAMTSFADPDHQDPATGPALREHVTEFLQAFPRPVFEVRRVVDGAVFWTMTAVHRGAYLGIAPTNAEVRLTGVDELADGAVVRYFDRTALTDQLHAARDTGGFEFGSGARLAGGTTGVPGALAFTRLTVRDDEEAAKADQLTAEILKALKPSKGFLGGMTVDLGVDKYTVSAFTDATAVRAVHSRAHQRAVRRFFTGGLCVGSLVSVWAPVSHVEFNRCDCGQVTRAGETCRCGTTPPPRPTI